ncbi:MAG: helix-turn-helix transcriptional regulator [Acidobacteriaceae bacterium]|nr:helix-turn-helix transcriptional regulator [Acidobacteriaceae bacterium]
MAANPESNDLTLEQAIGRVLRALRADRKMTQLQVAVETGFADTTIRNMESGKKSTTIRSLDAVSMFYKLPIEEIIVRAKALRNGPPSSDAPESN